MTYVNLCSDDARAALERAKETTSVRAIAGGDLRIDNIMGMTDIEARAAFEIIRWGESDNVPVCPKCRERRLYRVKKRTRWVCTNCTHQFTSTSGTIISSTKMPIRNYLFALSMVMDRTQFASIAEFARELRLGYKSSYELIQKMRACVTDAKGCTVPFSLIDRVAWLARRAAIRQNLGPLKFAAPASSLNYPYFRDDKKRGDGADLVLFVNALVPMGIPDHVRADVCQDMLVALLEGEISRDYVKDNTKQYISSVFAAQPWKYKWLSMDAPRSIGGETTAKTLHDLLHDPYQQTPEDNAAFADECSLEEMAYEVAEGLI